MTALSLKQSARPPISVICESDTPVRQPDEFRVCPLGMQLYSNRPIPDFEIVDFTIKLPGHNGDSPTIACSGVVVHSRPEKGNGSYRIWVKFLDLPDSERQRIQCVARDGDLLCPHCENFR